MADDKADVKEPQAEVASAPAEVSERDKAKAQKWFKKGDDCRERREYDYAIECYITGLNFWTEAIEEGFMPLRALALQRYQAGGKKPGMMAGLKRSMTGKDTKQAMLNAAFLLAKDPTNNGYLDGLLKAAAKAGYPKVVAWVAPLVMESLRKDKKPNKGRFKSFREVLDVAATHADEVGDHVTAASFYELAVQSVEYLMTRDRSDHALRDVQRDMSGKLTIARGKYADSDSFRESLRDGEQQKLLHDSDRLKQADKSADALVAAARKELEENPGVPSKINALVDALLRREAKGEEDEAVTLLVDSYEDSGNYSFKLRADDIRLKQLVRSTRALEARAKDSGSQEDRQQARLAAAEQAEAELEIYKERTEKYPTDMNLRFRLGSVLFKTRSFDEAIPILQAAQAAPKNRARAQLLIGRCFYETESYAQAREVLQEALAGYELTNEVSKALTYWLARALEAEGQTEDARATYGKLLRQDYNYAGGDARKRHDALKS